MAVQFILGRSGYGKTSYCISAVVDALLDTSSGQTLILLVPEQATYQAERAILSDKRITGYSRLHVLSFDRLQFMLMGKSTARQPMSRVGQQMIIHKILREQKSNLKILRSSVDFQGTSRQLADVITELHQYAETPQDIDQFLNNLDKDLHKLTALKLADISLVFKEYLNFVEDKFIDPDMQLARACRAVSNSFVKGAKLWIDGFAGFTPAEFAMLAELLKTVSDTQIALCLDPSEINPAAELSIDELDRADLFYPTHQSYVALLDIIKRCKIRVEKPVILNKQLRFSNSAPLAHIEQNIFKINPPKQKISDGIKIVSAPNARSEVQFVARQILELVKRGNFRFRDIAVIASDLDSYQHYIRAYFDDYQIPFFIDKRKPLTHHPAVSLICSALEVVVNKFSSGDIFNYLKTDLVNIERGDVDLLENYCLAFGITSDDWLSDKSWNYQNKDNPLFDEQQINRTRKKVRKPLIELREKLCSDADLSPKEFTGVIFDFLTDLDVARTTASWIESAEKIQDRESADRHRQSYSKILDIFDELTEVFADNRLSCKDYLAVINSAFSQLTLAFIPPALDQVLVGSIERSRHPDLKAVFLIGATQKQFPVPLNCNSILTDSDRSAAKLADFPLAGATDQKLAEHQYLAYIAFTRPTQFLYISYPTADDKAVPLARSQFIDNLQSVFENLNEEHTTDYDVDISNIHSGSELAEFLCNHLGKDSTAAERDNSLLESLLEDLCNDDVFKRLGCQIRSAITYDNIAQLDGRITSEIFGRQIALSSTRLSTFASCPYQYFAKYVLRLKEREEFKFEPLDLGTFYHAVLDTLLKRLNNENKSFATIDDDTLLKILKEEILRLINTDSFISNFVRHRPHNAFLIQMARENLEYCVLAIAKMVCAGSFCPRESECYFGQPDKGLGEFKLNLSNNRQLFLNGKIDRIDTADIDGDRTAIVFDYKRKGTGFSWSKFYYGLDMQLPIYMLAAANTSMSPYKNIIGAFYMPIEAGIKNVTIDQSQRKPESFDYKAKGIFNGQFYNLLDKNVTSGWSRFYNFAFAKEKEQYGYYNASGALTPNDFEKLLKFAERKIVQLAKQLTSGKIDITPYKLGTKSSCQTCKYKSLCRFDGQINDYNYLNSVTKQQVLQEAAENG